MTTPSLEVDDDKLAVFFRQMADRFLSRQSNQFILSGNVADLVDGLGVVVPTAERTGEKRYCYLDEYFSSRLVQRGRMVVTFNIARGINFASNEAFNALREWYALGDASGELPPAEQKARAQRFDRTVAESQVYSLLSLRFLEEICRLARMRRTGPVAQGISIIIKHADTLIPDNPVAQMGDLDRQKLTLVTEWFTDPEFQDSLEQVILIAPTMASVHESIRRLPHVSMIEVPRPDADARREFIRWMHARTGRTIKLRRTQKELAEITAGMTLLTLESLFLQAKHRNGELEEADILESLNRLLMSELGDKIELVKPRHSMADVIGATAIKAELSRLQKLLAKRDPSIAPTGILVAGPNGVGKTFIFEAWATECDRLVIVLKNLRGMYFGQTDQTFERLRNVLEALGNVIILVDEADTVFGKPGANTHETEARLFGNVIRMMGDPKNRGRIVWLLLTARPDNLAPDLKRSGRAGLHLPVFDPEGEDRKAYVRHILKRAGCDPASLKDSEFAALELHTAKYSPADFNELLVELKAERALRGDLGYKEIDGAISNILAGQIARQRRIQTLHAALECSRAALLPPSLASKTREELENELAHLLRAVV